MNLRRLSTVAAFVAVASVAASCGSSSMDHNSMGSESSTSVPAGPAAAPDKTVEVKMIDIGFDPATVSVNAGETVKFVFHNTGKIEHEAMVGDETVQNAHEQEMRGSKGMQMKDANALTVKPGATGELTHTFSSAGQTTIGCHEPGHYAAGMRIKVSVV